MIPHLKLAGDLSDVHFQRAITAQKMSRRKTCAKAVEMLIMNTVHIAFARVDDNETPGDRLSVAGVLDVCIAVRKNGCGAKLQHTGR